MEGGGITDVLRIIEYRSVTVCDSHDTCPSRSVMAMALVRHGLWWPWYLSVTVCDGHGTCPSRSVMAMVLVRHGMWCPSYVFVTFVIKHFVIGPSRLCVCHVCDQAVLHVSVTSMGGGAGRGSKFLPINFNTSFQFVFHNIDFIKFTPFLTFSSISHIFEDFYYRRIHNCMFAVYIKMSQSWYYQCLLYFCDSN